MKQLIIVRIHVTAQRSRMIQHDTYTVNYNIMSMFGQYKGGREGTSRKAFIYYLHILYCNVIQSIGRYI